MDPQAIWPAFTLFQVLPEEIPPEKLVFSLDFCSFLVETTKKKVEIGLFHPEKPLFRPIAQQITEEPPGIRWLPEKFRE
jgi:hypothetical protein